MNKKTSFSRRKRSAFTLIEIMVATVIMIILVGLVIQITSEVLKVWTRSSGKLSANAEARIALEMLTQDIETAVFRNNNMRWLEANTEDISPVAGYTAQTVNLILFAPVLDRPKEDLNEVPIPGDICAVQYQLVNQNPVTGASDELSENIFALHRRVIDPSTTFNRLMGAGFQENFDAWASVEVTPADGVNMEYLDPKDPKNYLVGHVANFLVEFYVINDVGDEVLVTSSEIKFGGGTDGASDATVGITSTVPETRYPLAYAEVSLTVLSDEGTKLLQNLAANRGGTGFQPGEGAEIVKQHGEVFTRRVNFVARPL